MTPTARARVTVVMSVFNGLHLTRACLESLRTTTEPFELIVFDNGSTDDTPAFLERFTPPYAWRRERNAENRSVIATLNRAWRLATPDCMCVRHNDTEVVDPAWLSKLLEALAEPRAGRAGLYGATRTRTFGERPEREREDMRLRAAVIDRFVGTYGHRLPADARSPRERVADRVRAKLVPAGDGGAR